MVAHLQHCTQDGVPLGLEDLQNWNPEVGTILLHLLVGEQDSGDNQLTCGFTGMKA